MWENPELNAKWHQMGALDGAGGADTVFVGSSLVGVGVDPAQYTAALDLARTAYNAALLSSSIAEQNIWIRSFVVPMLRPDTIIIGVSGRELNANDELLDLTDRVFPDLPPVRHALAAESSLERADRVLREVSYLFRYREVLRQPTTMFDNGPLTPEAAMTSRGMSTVLLDQQFTPFDPETLARHDGIQRFELDESRLAELGELVRWLVGQEIDAVVVNMPLPAEGVALFPNGTADYSSYSERLDAVITDVGGQYIATGVWSTAEFADQGHLNRMGAQHLTGLLAQQVH